MKTFNRVFLCFLFTVVIWQTAFPQVNCTGTVSTGQNLVTNGDFSNLYNGWAHDTAYKKYTPCDGCYSVPGNIYAGSVPSNFNQAFANIQDHSPSGDNNFLMVDGICEVGIDLWRQSGIPIIPNTNYYFSVWITSLSPASLAESGTLQFNINGEVLKTTIAAPGVVGQWVRFPGVVWNSGLNPPSSITISIQNTTTTACDRAVDFAIDDITFTQGCDFGVTGPQPFLGGDFTLCGKSSINLTPGFKPATAASPNMTYTWYKDGVKIDPGGGMGPQYNNIDVFGPGVYTVCVDSAGSCPKSDEIRITDDTHPPTRAWSPDSAFCIGSMGTIRLRAEGGSGTTLRWFRDACGTNQVASNTNGAEVTVPAPAVETTYYARWESATCQTTCASVTIRPTTPPSPANAGPRQDLCNAVSATLAANTAAPTGAIGTWSVVSGTGNVVNVNDPNSAVTGLVSGDLVLRWTVSNGPCPVSNSQVTIHVDQLSAPAITGSDLTQCSTATNVNYSTTVNNAPSSTYTWTVTGSLSITGGASTNSVSVNIGSTGGTLTVTEKKGACSLSASETITSVHPPDPNTISAGPRQDLCNATSATLAATPVSTAGATGLWSIVSGTGNLPSPANAPNATVTGLVSGDLVLEWAVTNAPCAAVSKQVIIHVDTLSAPVITGASPNQCATATGVVYSTLLNRLPSSTYTWTKTGSLIITSQPANTAIVDVGSTGGILTVTETRGACNLSASVNITSVMPLDPSSAGQPQNLCNATATILSAVPPNAPSIGYWTKVSGAGVIADADTTKFNAPVTGLEPGDLVLRWNVKNSPCADKSADVIIHVDTLPVPVITGASPMQCATAIDVLYATSVDRSPASTYDWTKTGSLVIKGHPANTAVVDVGATGGVLTVTETFGACSLSSSVTIHSVQPLTAASAGPNQQICNATATVLSATEPAPPSIGFWTIVSGTGTIAAANMDKFNAPVTGLVPGILHLRWTIRNSPCADSTADVTIRTDTLSKPVLTGASFDTCAMTTNAVYATNADHSPASTYTWSTSGSLVITGTSNNRAFVDVGMAGGMISVTESIGGCSFTASKEITIAPNVTDAVAGINQVVCLEYTQLIATPPAVGKGHWTVIGGSGTIADPYSPVTQVAGLSAGVNSFRWTVTGCGGPLTDDVEVTFGSSDLVLGAITGPSDTSCVGTPRTLMVSVTGGSGEYFYVWRSSDSSYNAVTTQTPVSVVPVNGPTTYYVYVGDSKNFGCFSNLDSIKIHAVSGQNLTMNNLMTPNEDNLNDQFIVRDAGTLQKILPGAKLEVFNKWGSKVFEKKDYDNTWEGSDLTDGVYFYHLDSGCGEDVYKGWVQIIR